MSSSDSVSKTLFSSGGGGTHLEKGYGDVQPLRPLKELNLGQISGFGTEILHKFRL